VILFDGSEWRSPADFYSALLPKLGAPDWHGSNLDALYDSLSGDINSLEPPFTVEVKETAGLSLEKKTHLTKVEHVFEDARKNLGVSVYFKVG
jgi:RNAse (barnase) inhibitor barstar